ncbi:hypothetical protein TSUD_301520 [Trifolium subterraneum]|uniref:Uncharacterized protein n=1 Tax=Trifolium subterraneum TaxID=3900 RepID=A0A2Z6PT02_TRISU|nr:hypothetical protein TSUD_301520 [Trifolium subterraneum]
MTGGNAIALLCFYIMQSNLGHPKLIMELLTEVVCVEQQHQWFVPMNGPLWRGIVVGFPSFQKCLHITRENNFSVLEFQLFTHVIFGCKIWIGNTVYVPFFLLSFGFQARNIDIVSKVSKYIGLIVHASIVGAQELVGINDGKKEAPDVYVPIWDSYQSCVVLTTSYLHVSKYCTSLVDASFHREHGDDGVCQNFSVAANSWHVKIHKNIGIFVVNGVEWMELVTLAHSCQQLLLAFLKSRKNMTIYVDTVDASLLTMHEWLRKYHSSEELALN